MKGARLMSSMSIQRVRNILFYIIIKFVFRFHVSYIVKIMIFVHVKCIGLHTYIVYVCLFFSEI